MDVSNVNPFLNACTIVMPQLGFTSVVKKNLTVSDKVNAQGVAVSVGIIGDIKGTVVYNFSEESAKMIASKMMFGMEVPTFDDMAQSAISELTNMLTANASIEFSKIGKNINISTPTLVTGKELGIKVTAKKILVVELDADGIQVLVNIGIESDV
jgi:chemotaxis protein CheX